jgi:glutathione S-transferase
MAGLQRHVPPIPQPLTQPMTLITIPISHYCEKVRWALDLLELPFVEQARMPPFHRSTTKRHGGGSVPLLVTPDGPIPDSDGIFRYLDRRCPGRLYPVPLDAAALKLDAQFSDVLGVHVRRWGYSYILSREHLRLPWTYQVPLWQRLLFPLIYPKLEPRVRTMMKVTATSAAESLPHVMAVFAAVELALVDGRRYLTGDRISGLDIAFAALAAPILAPPEHHIPAPLAALPPPMQAEIAAARATLAGQFGLRLYREHRRVKA